MTAHSLPAGLWCDFTGILNCINMPGYCPQGLVCSSFSKCVCNFSSSVYIIPRKLNLALNKVAFGDVCDLKCM